MAEYEPDDSRDVTNRQARAPGEPLRTGPREDHARDQAGQQTAQDGAQSAEAGGDRSIEGDSPSHPDRMGSFAGESAATDQAEQGSESENDRWADKAASNRSGDGEDYTPEDE